MYIHKFIVKMDEFIYYRILSIMMFPHTVKNYGMIKTQEIKKRLYTWGPYTHAHTFNENGFILTRYVCGQNWLQIKWIHLVRYNHATHEHIETYTHTYVVYICVCIYKYLLC